MTTRIIEDWRGRVEQKELKPGLMVETILEPSQALLELRANPPEEIRKAEQRAEIDSITTLDQLKTYLKKEQGL